MEIPIQIPLMSPIQLLTLDQELTIMRAIGELEQER